MVVDDVSASRTTLARSKRGPWYEDVPAYCTAGHEGRMGTQQLMDHGVAPGCKHADTIAELRSEITAIRRELDELRSTVIGSEPVIPRSGGAGRPSETPVPSSDATERSVQAPGRSEAGATSPAASTPMSRGEKLTLYRALFAGRVDVYARRWENRAKGTSGWAPAHAGSWATPRDEREYVPLTDDVVAAHLEGRDTIGLYPLLSDDTCRLLVCDFDKSTWQLDAQAYCEAAAADGVPTATEISRSGAGAHVWVFFTAPVASADARAMGAALLREAIALRGELDLDSYDRFFPSQDYLPQRGFGNLVALPLQGRCRRDMNTTVFVDPVTFQPWADQFGFLGTVTRMTPEQVRRTLAKLRPVTVGPDTGLHRSNVRPDPNPPPKIDARLGGMLAIRRAGIPPGLLATLKHLAVLHNPEFHKNERLRISNHATPRFIRCYHEDVEHLFLPRGLTEAAGALVAKAGSRLDVVDERAEAAPVELAFRGELSDVQTSAVDELARHGLGILEAPPGAGKTVMACALIALHRTPTLVLVDRRELVDQWRAQLRTCLDVDAGQIGAGKRHQTHIIDVATFQTIIRSTEPDQLLDGNGLVVVDECHRVAAPTVERTVRNVRARRWLGLTATPQRPDGLKEVMMMQCGPIRHRIDHIADGLARVLRVHETALRVDVGGDGLSRGELLALVYAAVIDDADRTSQICGDVADAMRQGRNCLVLSGRTDHVQALVDHLRDLGLDPLMLHGGLNRTQKRAVHARLIVDKQVLLIATDRYIGEGFDCPRLDTAFLTFPVSAPQRITQYVGRILREHPGKTIAEVHDYRDAGVPLLEAMYRRRYAGYKKLRFSTDRHTIATPPLDLRLEPHLHRSPIAPTSTKPADHADVTASDVRAWARAAGIAVSERGRLASETWEAYRTAHP